MWRSTFQSGLLQDGKSMELIALRGLLSVYLFKLRSPLKKLTDISNIECNIMERSLDVALSYGGHIQAFKEGSKTIISDVTL